jgi:predicted phage replisome organizer
MAEKKRYWLKLDKDFLKSPHMKVIKNMPNGKDYVLFYLTLMLESIETIGHLRFSDLVPYNEDMLSSITDINVDIVRSAVKVFCELGLIQKLDDGTIFMTQVASMTGKETESAERVRLFRDRQKQITLQCNGDVTTCNDNKEKEKDKQSTEKKKDIDIISSSEDEPDEPDEPDESSYSKYKDVLDLYTQICTKLPKIAKLTAKRKTNINKLLKEMSLEEIEKGFKIINSSQFCTGLNDRNWKADFDFCIKADKLTNALEGKYSVKPNNNGPNNNQSKYKEL